MEIGKLFVSIAADLKDFKSGLATVQSDMKGLSGTIMKHNKAIGGAMLGMGTAIAGAGLMSVKTYAETGDAVAKMAKRTGFTTETLSELKHAMELSGASFEGIEKASRTLSGAIIDSAAGLETYTRAFDRIGLKAEDLIGLSIDEQFVKVAEALAATEDDTVRTATAMDLFGRTGTALLPMFDQGIEGLNAMRQEAHELGIVFDEEAAAKAENMKDAVLRMERAIQSIAISIADVLIPALQPLIDLMTSIISGVRRWIDANKPLKIAIIAVAGALSALLIPLGMLIMLYNKERAELVKTIASKIAHKVATIASTAATVAQTAALVAHKVAAIASTVAQIGLNVATIGFSVALNLVKLALGPVGLAIMAITAIGIALWKNWQTITNFFKTTVINAFKEVWEFLKEWGLMILGVIFPPALVVGAIMKWKDEIVGALKKVWDAIVSIAKAPLNAIIGLFNKMVGFFSGKVLFSFKLPGWIPGIGGKGFTLKLPTIPKIPSLKYGGIVPGPIGEPVPIIAHGGEPYLGVGARLPRMEPATTTIGELHIHTLAFAGTRADAYKLWGFLKEAARGEQRGMLGEAQW